MKRRKRVKDAIGIWIKEVRRRKRLKADAVYHGMFRKSQYYAFERGEANVDMIKLETIFQRLGKRFPQNGIIIGHRTFEKVNIRYKIVEMINKGMLEELSVYINQLKPDVNDIIMMQYYEYALIVASCRKMSCESIKKDLLSTLHRTKKENEKIENQCFSEIESMILLKITDVMKKNGNRELGEQLKTQLVKNLKRIYLVEEYQRRFDFDELNRLIYDENCVN